MNAAKAVALRFVKSPRTSKGLHTEGLAYYEQALSMFSLVVNESASYTVIFALILLCYWSVGATKPVNAWMCINNAIAMARIMGLHDEAKYPAGITIEEREIRRSLWWTLFKIERDGAGIQYDLPFVTSEASQEKVPYPILYLTDVPNRQDAVAPFNSFAATIELTFISCKASKLLKREAAIIASGTVSPELAEIDMERSLLDLELQMWYSKLPLHLAHVQQNYSPTPTTTSPTTWRDASMLAIYFNRRIELQLPKIVRMADLGLHHAICSDPNFEMVVQCSLAIVDILKVFLKHNPYLCYTLPSITNCLI
eukprot:jgi/Hompol1/2647/HPOL_006114-RA